VVVVSWAVTTTAIDVLLPAVNACAPDAAPDVTALPATVTDAVASVVVGVTVTEATAFATVAVYEVVAATNDGDSVPALSAKLLSVASVYPAFCLVTVTVYVLAVVPSPPVTTTAIADPTVGVSA
jgi:hypothetical protein